MYHYFTSVYHRSWWYDPQFLIYRMCHSEISNFRSFFFAYLPPSKPKKSALFYTCAPKVTITWCMAPEIHNETERIFCYFAYFSPPFTPLTTWKIKILKKWKNHLDMSSFYTWTKNHNHMMYASWDMECNRQILLSFWASFGKFTPETIQKIKILKNWTKYLEIL